MAHPLQMTLEIETLGHAAAVVLAARKDRVIVPQGSWDKAQRWYPEGDEDADDYTLGLRSPSRAWPYSYIKGASTRNHMLGLARCAPEFLRAEAAKAAKAGAVVTTAKGVFMAKAILKQRRAEHDAAEAARVQEAMAQAAATIEARDAEFDADAVVLAQAA